MLWFILDLYEESKDDKYKSYAKKLVNDILSKGVNDSVGLHWPMEHYGFIVYWSEPTDFTGYFYGAAGYGLMLFDIDAVENQRNLSIVLHDNPFDWNIT